MEESSSQLGLCRSPPSPLDARVCCQGAPGPGEFWRPWLHTPNDAERRIKQTLTAFWSPPDTTENSAKLTHYTHPVKLFWPKSRCFDYLYHEAEALLRNFPVQATISFYEDSESEEDNESENDSGGEPDYELN